MNVSKTLILKQHLQIARRLGFASSDANEAIDDDRNAGICRIGTCFDGR